jgi:hypothetical protein
MEKFSHADHAERIARELGPFLSSSEQAEAAKSAFSDEAAFTSGERMVYHARARLTAEGAKASATLKNKFGLNAK